MADFPDIFPKRDCKIDLCPSSHCHVYSRNVSSYQGYRRCVIVCNHPLLPACLAYNLRREDTDWFDKPREGHLRSGNMSDRRQVRYRLPFIFTLFVLPEKFHFFFIFFVWYSVNSLQSLSDEIGPLCLPPHSHQA